MITIVCGTNRPKSKSAILALYYQSLLAERGVASQILDLGKLPADFTSSALYENTGKNEAFNQVSRLINESEKFIFIIPEYNYSFPGVLKAFVDGLSYPHTFRNKKAALVGLSSGMQGGAVAVSHFTDILHYLGTFVLPAKPRLAFIEKNMSDGQLTNQLYIDMIVQQVDSLIAF